VDIERNEVSDQVAFDIFDLTNVKPGAALPGFYWNIFDPDRAPDAEAPIEGPYPTKAEAIAAAQEFIRNILAEASP
jgi:hypothetical protein